MRLNLPKEIPQPNRLPKDGMVWAAFGYHTSVNEEPYIFYNTNRKFWSRVCMNHEGSDHTYVLKMRKIPSLEDQLDFAKHYVDKTVIDNGDDYKIAGLTVLTQFEQDQIKWVGYDQEILHHLKNQPAIVCLVSYYEDLEYYIPVCPGLHEPEVVVNKPELYYAKNTWDLQGNTLSIDGYQIPWDWLVDIMEGVPSDITEFAVILGTEHDVSTCINIADYHQIQQWIVDNEG